MLSIYHPETKLFPSHNIIGSEGRQLFGSLNPAYLLRHFELDIEKPFEDMQALQLTETLYDQLHQIEPSVIDSMINNEKLAHPLRLFLSDFKSNQQEFDNVSLMEMDYVKDYAEIIEVVFLLPSENFVWHLGTLTITRYMKRKSM